MNELVLLFLGTIFVNNFVFSRFLGLCPYIGVSKKIGDSVGMGLAVIFVLLLAAVFSWCIQFYLLQPLHLEYLQTIVFILVIATLVQLVEMALMKTAPALYQALGIYLPLITTNCIILAVAILNVREQHNLLKTVVFSLGAGAGFMMALVLMASIRERLELANVPKFLKGEPLAFIVAGLIAIAFIGFTGLL
ncbi:electron transport complex protein RnfA [Hydrogenispora ethanolica]|uniref:Ion-translocating oxidoreductase complex subunit A n=1 Tax=Hydrogenispora ethanolica TaxID=1082276 RepID=A0A4R1S3H1_HYDET|nr:electron transport complex subunit RsxA [Hydrogenispora ethanolica]TCL73170.1 electron transport complex protein RnfA [Hydrogenispora ethanolica]